MKTTNATPQVCAHTEYDDKVQVCDPCKNPSAARPIKQTAMRFAKQRTGKVHPRTPRLLKAMFRANEPHRTESAVETLVRFLDPRTGLSTAPHPRRYSML